MTRTVVHQCWHLRPVSTLGFSGMLRMQSQLEGQGVLVEPFHWNFKDVDLVSIWKVPVVKPDECAGSHFLPTSTSISNVSGENNILNRPKFSFKLYFDQRVTIMS